MTAKDFIKQNYSLTNGEEDYVCNHSGQLVGAEDIAEAYHKAKLDLENTVKVNKTSENELLIHKLNDKGNRLNIIVDSEGEIEIIHIGKTAKETWHKFPVTLNEALEFWNK